VRRRGRDFATLSDEFLEKIESLSSIGSPGLIGERRFLKKELAI